MNYSTAAISVPLLDQKEVLVDFDGGHLSSDAGFVLMSRADQRLHLIDRMAAAIVDRRAPGKVKHSTRDQLRERVFLIALGYADANDANALRHDPILKLALGKPGTAQQLAGQSTLSRLENAVTLADVERVAAVLLQVWLDALTVPDRPPQRLVLDLDPFEDPAHGQQQGVLFNGYYKSHCYLPLYFCGSFDGGRQWPIGALLREGTASATRGSRWALRQIIRAVRARFPAVQIIVRGDSAFGCARMLRFCRRLGVDYCFGVPQNKRLLCLSQQTQMRAALSYTLRQRRGCAKPFRAFGEFQYKASTWKQRQRVINKTEVTRTYGRVEKLNPRFIVTSLRAQDGWTTRACYHFYCQRGDPENRIKELKLHLQADRLSCHAKLANQFRLLLHLAAYALFQIIQETLAAACAKTEWATAQVATLRTRVLKVAAQVVTRCRVVRVHLPRSFPLQAIWRALLAGLAPAGG